MARHTTVDGSMVMVPIRRKRPKGMSMCLACSSSHKLRQPRLCCVCVQRAVPQHSMHSCRAHIEYKWRAPEHDAWRAWIATGG